MRSKRAAFPFGKAALFCFLRDRAEYYSALTAYAVREATRTCFVIETGPRVVMPCEKVTVTIVPLVVTVTVTPAGAVHALRDASKGLT